jgi:hypothetical protein
VRKRYKEVWKPVVDAVNGQSSKKPSMKLAVVLAETIDGKLLHNTFGLSLGGHDHVLVRNECTNEHMHECTNARMNE